MNNPLELESVIASTREILAQLLVLDIEDIEADSSIVEDLSADSLDIVDLSFQLGRRYGCVLPKTSVLDHAAAVCGDLQAFVDAGGLTPAGKALLEGSLNAYADGQLRPGMKPADVFAATTVRNWAAQCHNLFDHLPESCPQCGGKHASLSPQNLVVCSSCSARLSPADGDQVSRLLVEKFVAANLQERV
ncbi:Acyl carrier protein [Pseudomonas sp. OF001]|uniref:acyl carrier protein n=1 Tax=Pseudomonas sp. OF001 TaxID=2772300 RepID=UPI00191AC252|nr:acyl carrier protein [Pseudomonas sp. OF001]CAD5378314.1 Acyl carrier protein [Pseudomonas sp. OF001]